MSDHVYKIIELTGSSKTSIEDPIQTAVKRAAKTVKNMRWFDVTEKEDISIIMWLHIIR